MHPNEVLHDCLSHGDQTSLAALMNVSPQYVSAFCRADGPPSFYAKFISDLRVMFAVSPTGVGKLLDDAQIRVTEWGRAALAGQRPLRALGDLVATVNQQTAEFVSARLAELPENRQRQEALDVIEAAQRFIRALDQEEGAAVRGMKVAGGRG